MRIMILLAALAISPPASAAEESPLFDFDWMGGFLVANELCRNQYFDGTAIRAHMAGLGGQMGWSMEKVLDETQRVYDENREAHDSSPESFCIAMQKGREQYGDADLRRRGVLPN